MVVHPNFYENVKEVGMRLNQTIVLYEGWPYYVLTSCDHKDDGIIRIYLDKLGTPEGPAIGRYEGIPYMWNDEPGITRGAKMDAFMAVNPDCGIIRKMMNSPGFNKFRPFPLGMCNTGGQVTYIERSPVRHTQQGLTGAMLNGTVPSYAGAGVSSPVGTRGGYVPQLLSRAMADTIIGEYPAAKECFTKLLDKTVGNTAAAFHREFAFVRGPVEDLIFLAYKSEIVGYMPNVDFSLCKLSRSFSHLKEVTENLGIFDTVK